MESTLSSKNSIPHSTPPQRQERTKKIPASYIMFDKTWNYNSA